MIWVYVHKDPIISIILIYEQCITFSVNWCHTNTIFSHVYVKCNHFHRKSFYASLCFMRSLNAHWMLIGDFNNIKFDDEELGSVLIPHSVKSNFLDFIDHNFPYGLLFLGSKYTWYSSRNGVYNWERLYWALVNQF